jgi:hypothetical protein
MNPLCIIIACIILLANNNPMKSFKQYLTEQQEKIKVTKPQPNIGSGQVKAQVREEEPPKEKEPTKPAELKTTQTEAIWGIRCSRTSWGKSRKSF